MIPGVQRASTPYVWPHYLLRPAGPRLVYLDLNHWIGLAKANTGHRDGARHHGALETLRRAKASSRFVFPLSATHYMELATITDPRQRADVASVMEELSGFWTLLSKAVVMRLEIEAVLDELGKPRPQPYLPMPLLGFGVGPALGVRGGLRIRDRASGEDVTETARQEAPDGPEEFDRRLAEAERKLERAVLQGPGDEDVPALKLDGWDPLAARRGAEERAEQEREQAVRFDADPRWRRGRIRDVVSARYVFIELNEMLAEALDARGLELGDVYGNPESARRLVDSMPSSDVSVSLVTAAHRNPQTRWRANDIFDLDALSLAVPYCDVVVTERHACHSIRAAGIPQRTRTEVLATLDELALIL